MVVSTALGDAFVSPLGRFVLAGACFALGYAVARHGLGSSPERSGLVALGAALAGLLVGWIVV